MDGERDRAGLVHGRADGEFWTNFVLNEYANDVQTRFIQRRRETETEKALITAARLLEACFLFFMRGPFCVECCGRNTSTASHATTTTTTTTCWKSVCSQSPPRLGAVAVSASEG